MNDIVIGCVGKPSAGKSSFLNAATEASAKVGNYPFTTIEPNYGVSFYCTQCPCKKYEKTELCAPKYGKCTAGKRYIPVKVLDVAGLVPGASEGKGLGNKFLDDLRHADVLLHVIDVSGTTNERGEATTGYDPINDIEWLISEIHAWIFNNLWKKWSSIARRHTATKSKADATLQNQVSGYGAQPSQVKQVLDKMGVKEPCNLEEWDEFKVHEFVQTLLDIRFPTLYVLNKVDLPESDKNISRICKKYGDQKVILTSALSEVFLRKLQKQNFIKYTEGDDTFLTSEEDTSLKPFDEKTKIRLEKVQDLVLFRYGGTGIQQAINRAVETLGMIPVYPVGNIHSFSSHNSKGVFRDCMLVYPKTTVRELAKKLSADFDKYFAYAESVSGMRLGEDDLLTLDNNIIKINTYTIPDKDEKKENK